MARNVRPRVSAVEANIRSVAQLERTFQERRTKIERLSDWIADFTGTIWFVIFHVVCLALWFLINTRVLPIVKAFDPYPFILLAMIVSVEGVLLSTFVLMKQNRMQQRSDARDHLNLQIDLLAERESTMALQLLQAICDKLEISRAKLDAELGELADTTSVDKLAEQIESDLPGR